MIIAAKDITREEEFIYRSRVKYRNSIISSVLALKDAGKAIGNSNSTVQKLT